MMSDTTDIEKKSLEAHVELCAERYRALDERFETINEKINRMSVMMTEIKNSLDSMANKNNDRIINWGIGIIVFLLSALGYLVKEHVLK
jgi:predicted  nucleic acid-binding Zn-ribbon protein